MAMTTHIVATPNDLKWADVPSLPRGAKIAIIEGSLAETGFATVRLKFPADYKVPPHFHPVVERVTILSGALNMGLGDLLDASKSTALPAGSIMVIPPQTHHFVWTKEETIVQLNVVTPWGITYVNPADDPRKQ
ncbi:MAG: cupin domain-containing protein [Chloroflexi bacterium]|nr:cupin domain-containing protein [Chloroflexota bacterium]